MKDAVITAGVRTAVGAFGKTLRPVSANELGRQVLNGLMDRTSIGKQQVRGNYIWSRICSGRRIKCCKNRLTIGWISSRSACLCCDKSMWFQFTSNSKCCSIYTFRPAGNHYRRRNRKHE